MNESIQNSIVRDPKVTEAIRDIKAQLKKLASEQRQEKKEFRAKQRECSLAGGNYTGGWCDQGDIITALHIISGKLRETKRPHLDEERYFDTGNYIGVRRRLTYNKVVKEFIASHAEAGKRLAGGAA